METLEKRIEKIEERNRRVEIDKDWETSKTRKVFLAVLTYVIISLFLIAIEVEKPWINSIVPAIGFLISTLSIPVLKNIWISINTNKN